MNKVSFEKMLPDPLDGGVAPQIANAVAKA